MFNVEVQGKAVQEYINGVCRAGGSLNPIRPTSSGGSQLCTSREVFSAYDFSYEGSLAVVEGNTSLFNLQFYV